MVSDRTCRSRSTPCPADGSVATCCSAATPFLDNAGRLARVRADQRSSPSTRPRSAMAKATTIKVKLVSSADTGFYYVTRKNSRTMTDKLVKKKYDPVAKKHVEFREGKIK